jgi:hypothetical protein
MSCSAGHLRQLRRTEQYSTVEHMIEAQRAYLGVDQHTLICLFDLFCWPQQIKFKWQ